METTNIKSAREPLKPFSQEAKIPSKKALFTCIIQENVIKCFLLDAIAKH